VAKNHRARGVGQAPKRNPKRGCNVSVGGDLIRGGGAREEGLAKVKDGPELHRTIA